MYWSVVWCSDVVVENATKPSRFAHSWQGAQSFAPATRNDISTSKSGPNPWCFVHFDFEMCFAPQRRALFRHRNFQKWSEHGVLCTFWLGHVLRATTVCNFFDISTSKSGPALVCFVHFDFEMCFAPQRRSLFLHLNFQEWSDNGVFLYILTSKCASRHIACKFSSLIWPAGSAPAALASLLFDPPEPQIIGKTQCFATFVPFRASASSFFWLFLFYSSLLIFSLLSASALLCFSSVHIVGSLTSKFPSPTTLHCITVHYTTLMTLHYATTTTATTIVTTTKLHYTTLHHATTTTTLPYTTLDCTTLYHTTVHNATVRYNTVHYDALH